MNSHSSGGNMGWVLGQHMLWGKGEVSLLLVEGQGGQLGKQLEIKGTRGAHGLGLSVPLCVY